MNKHAVYEILDLYDWREKRYFYVGFPDIDFTHVVTDQEALEALYS